MKTVKEGRLEPQAQQENRFDPGCRRTRSRIRKERIDQPPDWLLWRTNMPPAW